MGEILVKEKQVVVPGDVLATGMEFLPSFGTYRLGDRIHASTVGLVHTDRKVIKLIPVAGGYIPRKDDVIIGKVIDILMSGWRVDFGSPYQAVLSLQEASSDYIEKDANLSQYFEIDEYVCAKVTKVTSQKLVDISMKGPGLKKLYGGRIVTVNPFKVPRVIGKQGSMVSLIKQLTGSWIMVGQNGWTWVKNDDIEKEMLTVDTIKMVDKNSHISGLTDKVKKFLEENMKGESK